MGSFELTLLLDPGGLAHTVELQLRSWAEKVAREVPIVVGALLFAQHEMRAINDPARLAAVDEMAATCRAARAGRLSRPDPPERARRVATYQVTLRANGGFRIGVEERLAGILSDVAGSLASGAIAAEILTTVREPFRTFYLEMLEAALEYWRDRRPSLIESTWVWTLALQRLNDLVRYGTANLGEPQVCQNCRALRPAGFPCLHCRAAPGEINAGPGGIGVAAPTSAAPMASAAPPDRAVPDSPGAVNPSVTVAPAPVPQATASPVSTSPSSSASAPPPNSRLGERTILPAQDSPPGVETASNERADWPLAGLVPRGVSLLIDLVACAILASLAAFGLTTILLAEGAFGPGDDPQQFANVVALLFFGLYFVLGWASAGTFGMMLVHLELVREADRRHAGLWRAIVRAFGYLLVLAAGLATMAIGLLIDTYVLFFIPGDTPADNAIRVIVGLIALYVVWLATGQRILGDPLRQTWADKLAKTLVVLQPRSS